MACLSCWRSPRSIPTGQDGRRPLQHKLQVTYIYVLKCITHPLRTRSCLSPSARFNPPGLAIHSATRTPNFIIIICPGKRSNEFEGERKTESLLQLSTNPKTPTPYPFLLPLTHPQPLTPISGLGDNIRTRC